MIKCDDDFSALTYPTICYGRTMVTNPLSLPHISKKCGVKTISEGQERYIVELHLELLQPKTQYAIKINMFVNVATEFVYPTKTESIFHSQKQSTSN